MYQNDGLVSGREGDAASASALGSHEFGEDRGDRRRLVGSRWRPHLRRVALSVVGQHERLKVYKNINCKKTLLFTDGKLLF